MKQIFTFFLILFSFQGFSQDEIEWFELGSTWTYNWNGIADPDQADNTYSYSVTEITEYLGKTCSKIQPDEGAFACLVYQPPYYMYQSNDTVFYATATMDEFAIGYVLSPNAEWQYEASVFEETTVYDVSVQTVFTTDVEGEEIPSYTLLYEAISGQGGVEIFPVKRNVVSYLGDLDLFIIPFGKNGVCDFESGEVLRCFSSPSLNYQNPDFTSCTLGTEEISERKSGLIYPNPAAENIFWDEPIDEIRLFDAFGKLVLQRTHMGSAVSLSVADLQTGFYTVLISERDKVFSQKLLVNR